MSDNIQLPGNGLEVATDEIATKHYQRVKLIQGADGANDGDVCATAPLQVTLANTGANATAVKVDGSAVTQPVSAASLPLPSGAATAANQTTIIGHVDGLEGLLTTIDADTSTLAGAVAGTEMQVDVVTSALPSGAATAAKQPALGTAGTASADVISVQGIASMTALKVDGSAVTQPVSGTVTANLSATDNAVLDNIDADTSAIQTAVELIDDAVYIDDADWTALTSKHALVGGVYQSTPGSITDGDTGPLRVDVNGHLITNAHSSSLAFSDASSNTRQTPVDETGAKIVCKTYPSYFNGTTWDRTRGDATNGLLVNLGANNDVTVTGSVTANAGTNLNTSALALETGGNLAAAATSLATIDNAVSGAGFNITQLNGAAVPIGAGLEATAVRVTLATDSTGLVSVDDNGGSLTVDYATTGSGTATGALRVELPTNGTGVIATVGTITNAVTVNSHAVTNAGTFVVQENGSALTALQVIDNPIVVDDAAFTPATTSVSMAGFTFDDVSPDTVNEGDAGAGRMSANRCQYVNIRDNAGNERGLNIDASGQLAVTLASGQTLGTVTTVSTVTAVTNVATIGTSVTPGTSAAHLGKAEDAAHTSGDTGVMALAVRNDNGATTFGANADYSPIGVNAAGAILTEPYPISTATITTLASAATSAQLLASTAGRKGLMLTNTDANGVYVKYGTTASATSFTVFIPGGDTTNGFGYWEMPAPIYTGRIDAIWVADGSGSLISTELT